MMTAPTKYRFPREEFAQLTNLRQLELDFMVLDEPMNMFFLCSFLRASPRLRKLVLKYRIDWEGTERKKRHHPFSWNIFVEFGERQWQLGQGCKYECLEEVEFLGWSGETEVEFVKHLIQAAGSLERITIDPSSPCRVGMWKRRTLSPEAIAAQEDARNRARDLEAKLSPTTKLLVL